MLTMLMNMVILFMLLVHNVNVDVNVVVSLKPCNVDAKGFHYVL